MGHAFLLDGERKKKNPMKLHDAQITQHEDYSHESEVRSNYLKIIKRNSHKKRLNW